MSELERKMENIYINNKMEKFIELIRKYLRKKHNNISVVDVSLRDTYIWIELYEHGTLTSSGGTAAIIKYTGIKTCSNTKYYNLDKQCIKKLAKEILCNYYDITFIYTFNISSDIYTFNISNILQLDIKEIKKNILDYASIKYIDNDLKNIVQEYKYNNLPGISLLSYGSEYKSGENVLCYMHIKNIKRSNPNDAIKYIINKFITSSNYKYTYTHKKNNNDICLLLDDSKINILIYNKPKYKIEEENAINILNKI